MDVTSIDRSIMGWKWVDDGDETSSRSRCLGDIANPNPRDSTAEEERFSTRRIVKSSCRTEEGEPGRFVRKCDKTEQLLRDCVGRPTEVVESKTEHTEDDVTDEVTRSRCSFESAGAEPFSFPGLHSDIESIEHGLFGGLGQFIEAAEEMAKGFFRSFNMPSLHNRESFPRDRLPRACGHGEKDGSKQADESPAYSGLAGEVTDV